MALSDTVRAVLEYKGIGVCTVRPETPVYEALEMMSERDIGAVLVMDAGDLWGVFSERDYARKVALHGKSSKNTPVSEAIGTPAVVAHLEQTVDDCMAMMTQHRIRHLPVVDCGKLAGVLSIGDLVKEVIADREETIKQLESYIHH